MQLSIFLNDKEVEELTQLCHVTKARQMGKRMAARLKETIPQQLFMVTIQAKVGAKVLAREDIKPMRKDVLAKCVSLQATYI